MALSVKAFLLFLILAIAIAGVIESDYAKAHPRLEGAEGGTGEATPTPAPEYHVHADVSVVVNGQRLPFTDFLLYQNPVACDDVKPGTESHNDGGIEAHFHNGNDKVAHYHAPGITWRQFWQARKVVMTSTCVSLPTGESWCNDESTGDRWQMVLNGKLVAWNPDTVPRNLDRVLFAYSRPLTQGAAKLEFDAQVSDDACIYSGSCPSRGTAPAESCGQPAA
ncbi:Uncharacterised protein [uncultured archaeon]|nr:Uncharacterised protein [uncultured archaeon]